MQKKEIVSFRRRAVGFEEVRKEKVSTTLFDWAIMARGHVPDALGMCDIQTAQDCVVI